MAEGYARVVDYELFIPVVDLQFNHVLRDDVMSCCLQLGRKRLLTALFCRSPVFILSLCFTDIVFSSSLEFCNINAVSNGCFDILQFGMIAVISWSESCIIEERSILIHQITPFSEQVQIL